MEYVMNTNEIMKILPHRYPFLMLDCILSVERDKYVKGVKNFTISEPMFKGHFPDDPIVPGVMIIEALAQVTAIMYCYDEDLMKQIESNEKIEATKRNVGYLAKVDNFKFKSIVRPGDQLYLYAEVIEQFGIFLKVKVWAETDIKVAEGILMVTHKNEVV